VAAISFFFAFISKNIFTFNKANLILVVLIIIIEFYVVKGGSFNSLIGAILRSIILSVVLLLNDRIKINLFQFFTNAFAILLTISMLEWILFLIGSLLPYDQTNFGGYFFRNYYLFLISQANFDYNLIPRFSSVFLEPGQLGMITTFFLIANKFELKRKPILIIFIATLLTFSLVAYVVLIISTSLYLKVYTQKVVRNVYIYILFIFLFYLFFSNYNKGDNAINNLIIARLKYENGDIAGNNRFSTDLKDYYKNIYKTDNFIFGLGAFEYEHMTWDGGNAGYKVFIMQYGIVGSLLVLLFYLIVLFSNKSKMAWILLAAYILIFLQASYPTWECELLIFITAVPFLNSYKQRNK
jgi:hypothetical protein